MWKAVCSNVESVAPIVDINEFSTVLIMHSYTIIILFCYLYIQNICIAALSFYFMHTEKIGCAIKHNNAIAKE